MERGEKKLPEPETKTIWILNQCCRNYVQLSKYHPFQFRVVYFKWNTQTNIHNTKPSAKYWCYYVSQINQFWYIFCIAYAFQIEIKLLISWFQIKNYFPANGRVVVCQSIQFNVHFHENHRANRMWTWVWVLAYIDPYNIHGWIHFFSGTLLSLDFTALRSISILEWKETSCAVEWFAIMFV